eukprot:CAMPEP_0201676184 /NCGR_PEP_ID=MMETSP0494-20130426/41246_1 /ASSEMBLY_ACC=CAM_ASM_000839 /TAXON_ID=420259 /ORGANISM="Thalassiosira gravida, Strain GMp14c1" /LENGTH=353 /DNA_ID=CAMNT_0048158835 /DNA_START=5 /DNA_END=1066 /DNA_ORIENTATION=-
MATTDDSKASPSAVSPSLSNILQYPRASPRKNKPRPVEDLFPSKLYHVLEKVETLGLSAAVSWQPHGRAFLIKDRDLFMTDVVPRSFKAKKIRSFQRQCHLWGFHRISTGRDAGSWWHESFIRGRPQELKHITRTRIKGLSSSLLNINPNFYEDDEDKCEKAPLPEMNISDIGIGSFIGKSGSFVDKSSDDMSSVSVGSSLEKDNGKEFEHLDEEREAWSENTTPRCVSLTSPDAPLKEKYHFGRSAVPNIPDLNSSSNIGCQFDLKRRDTNWNQAPVRRVSLCISNLSSSMSDNASMNQPLPDRSRSFSLDYSYQPDYVRINCDRSIDAYAQEDVESVDEFSKFIEKTIHLP